MTGYAAAFSLNDIIDFFKGLLGGGGDNVVCDPPYMKVGDECCLDRNGNRICDNDEQPSTTRPRPPGTTQPTGTTQPGAGATTQTTQPKATTTQPTQTTLATNLKYKRVTLTGTLVSDVDPVMTKDKRYLIQPTREAGKGSYADLVDMNAMSLAHNIMLSGDLVSGVDVHILSDSKTALIHTKKSPAVLDKIDIAAKAVVKSADLAGQVQADVDTYVTPDETKALVPTRQDPSNSFLEIVDIASLTVANKVFLTGDLEPGVDCMITSDSGKAMMPTYTPTLKTNVHFIDLSNGKILKKLGLDGVLEEDVDGKLKSNDEIILMPTKTSVRGFLTIIEAKAMSIQRRIELSGTLKESVDVYFLPGERMAYIPVTKGSQGFLDIIDVTGKQLKHSVKLSGDLVKGVDAKHVPDGSKILMPSHRGPTAYLDIIDPGTGNKLKTVTLSGMLQEHVDVQVSEDGKTAYMPVTKPGRGKIDIIDVASGSILKTIDLKAGLKDDVDALLTINTKKLAVSSSSRVAYVDVITNAPSKSLTALTSGMGTGYVDIIDLSSNTLFGSMGLGGDLTAGVDGTSGELASTTPHYDEDMVVEGTDTTTTTYPPTTSTVVSSTTTTTVPWTPVTTTTIGDIIPTTTVPGQVTTTTLEDITQTTTTTISDAVITPRCGDGYLSWSGAPGGGSEECDPNTGPYNNWDGAQVYPCPSGLQCVNCKCVGCGDGRLQQPPEECDSWRYKVKVNNVWLWEGDLIDCREGYECDWNTCQCEKLPVCGDGELDPGEECEVEMVEMCLTGFECNLQTCHCDKVPYCGDGILDQGEQCETGSPPWDYRSCIDCMWVTDCNSFCSSRPDTGDGTPFTNVGGVGSSTDCADKNNPNSQLAQAIAALSEDCYATCGKGYFLPGISGNCCCLKTNKVACIDCPGLNPNCDISMTQCRASIPM
ncbi:MAG: hypothetical protein GF416_07230 [Candidatus Altiarchaeales archaeon]|nr:hypothetical protein [Candidatus Altiarchaeales archaeon]MBD3416904.1 hypothetical protein [Candidatus Altiarchaeales archaeon]